MALAGSPRIDYGANDHMHGSAVEDLEVAIHPSFTRICCIDRSLTGSLHLVFGLAIELPVVPAPIFYSVAAMAPHPLTKSIAEDDEARQLGQAPKPRRIAVGLVPSGAGRAGTTSPIRRRKTERHHRFDHCPSPYQ
jgi:hypothetical protein